MDPEAPRLIPLAEASARPAEFEARPDARAGWAAFLVLTALSLACVVGPFLTGWPVWVQALTALWFGGWCALVARIAWHGVAGARDPGGWALKAGPDGLLVNLRSHLNYRHPAADPVVLELKRARVRRLAFLTGAVDEPHYEDGVRRSRRVRREVLELEAWDDLGFLRTAIAEEAQRWSRAGLGRARVRHLPVSVSGDRLRIAWSDPARKLIPVPAAAETVLGKWHPVARRLAEDLAAIETLPRADQERRLADLARGGQAVTAIALARELWGLSLTEARALVDRLTAP